MPKAGARIQATALSRTPAMTEHTLWMVEEGVTDDEGRRAGDLAREWAERERARRGEEIEEGEVERAASVIRELFKLMDEEVAARVEELAQMMVHELKDPLSQVQIGMEMLAKSTAELGEEERTYLGWMQRGTGRAVEVLDDVRVLGLAEARQDGPRLLPILTLVESVFARAGEEAERKGVRFEVEGELPTATVDGAQVGMALGNLVSNSVKYADVSKPERWVRVRVERVTGAVEGWRFSVADNGLGIPTRLQRDVFRRHFRAHPGAAQGMGLGLSIAQQVIERRNGHMWFHSEERKGTVFHFVIPDPPERAPKLGDPPAASVAQQLPYPNV